MTDGANSTCPDSNRDSDYVDSMVSDGDYPESTTGHDDMNGEVDTESTSSSFIFSPPASSSGTASRATAAAAAAALLERDSLISGAIQAVTPPLAAGAKIYPEKTQLFTTTSSA